MLPALVNCTPVLDSGNNNSNSNNSNNSESEKDTYSAEDTEHCQLDLDLDLDIPESEIASMGSKLSKESKRGKQDKQGKHGGGKAASMRTRLMASLRRRDDTATSAATAATATATATADAAAAADEPVNGDTAASQSCDNSLAQDTAGMSTGEQDTARITDMRDEDVTAVLEQSSGIRGWSSLTAAMAEMSIHDTMRITDMRAEDNTVASQQSGDIGGGSSLTGAMANMPISGQDINGIKRNRDDESDAVSSEYSGGINITQGVLDENTNTENAGGEAKNNKRVKRMHGRYFGSADSEQSVGGIGPAQDDHALMTRVSDMMRIQEMGLSGTTESVHHDGTGLAEDMAEMSMTGQETKHFKGKGIAEPTPAGHQPHNETEVSPHEDRMLVAELDELYEEMKKEAEMTKAGKKVEEKKVEEKKPKTGWTGPDIVIPGDTKMRKAGRESWGSEELMEGEKKLKEGIKRDAEMRRKFMGGMTRVSMVEQTSGASTRQKESEMMIAADEEQHWGSFETWSEEKKARAKMEQETLWRDAKRK